MDGYIGVSPEEGVNNETRIPYVATGGQTTFNISYTPGFLDVYINGVLKIAGTDYTATNGTSFVMSEALVAGDEVFASARYASSPFNFYNQTDVDEFLAQKLSLSGGTMTGALAVQVGTLGSHPVRKDEITTTFSAKRPSVIVTQSAGALTISVAPMQMDFRSQTLTSGVSTPILAAPDDFVIPTGATLGFPSGVAGDVIVIEMNNGGIAEIAAISLAGAWDLSEKGVISTTAVDANADSANVFYSTSARVGLSYRVIKRFTATNTGGAWGDPSAVFDATADTFASLGYGQKWIDVSGSRSNGVTYYNLTGKTISVSASCTGAQSQNATLVVNGVSVCSTGVGASNIAWYGNVTGDVPPGSPYYVTTSGSINYWSELRP